MRKIKFRGYSIKYKRWVYGYLYTWYSDVSDKVVYNIIYDDFHLVVDGISYGWNGFEVDPESVGQFIGLYDNTSWADLTEEEKKYYENGDINGSNWDGIEVYEGDIVEFYSVFYHYEGVGIIKWFSNGFYIVGQKNNDIFFIPDNMQYIKVIGNIYENLKLLKGDKK